MIMQAALLPDRGVVKVVGADARTFLNGLLTTDMATVSPERARFAALLTPQGKIVIDCIVAEVPPQDGVGFFLDCPRALAVPFVTKLNFYKLRARVLAEDLSETLGVLAAWGGQAKTDYGLTYADPRLPDLGVRMMIPPHLAEAAAKDIGATLVDAADYEAHRIALGVPRGGLDFMYGDAFPHETAMDQLAGIDFDKGCYVGQEVVSRMQHRGTARTRTVRLIVDGPSPATGSDVMADGKSVGRMGSARSGHALALLRIDKVSDALAKGASLSAGGIAVRLVDPADAKLPEKQVNL
jgi:folate-binding protein YgfZ